MAILRQAGDDPNGIDILINPGGPGFSGIDYVLSSSERLREDVGPRHNLVGFDPRGVGRSQIRLSCFQDSVSRKVKAGFQRARANVMSSGLDDEEKSKEIFSQTEAYGKQCNEANRDSDSRYAGTVAVAQDMLHYAKLLAQQQGTDKERAMLNFYGGSYGSTLGLTFAALYPQNVGRMIVDGVENINEHYNGKIFGALRAIDAAADEFFSKCHLECTACDFCKPGNSLQDLKDRFDGLIAGYRAHPIPIESEKMPWKKSVKASDILDGFLSGLRYYAWNWPVVARDLVLWENRNVDILVWMKESDQEEDSLVEEADDSQPAEMIDYLDSAGRIGLNDVEDIKRYLRDAAHASKYGGQTSVVTELSRWQHAGNVTPPDSQIFTGLRTNIKTATPVLFTTNRLDAVTPYAHQMATFFPGAVVLEQDSFGHTTQLVSSNCTRHFRRMYFENGTLPQKGTICAPDEPFSFGGSGRTSPKA